VGSKGRGILQRSGGCSRGCCRRCPSEHVCCVPACCGRDARLPRCAAGFGLCCGARAGSGECGTLAAQALAMGGDSGTGCSSGATVRFRGSIAAGAASRTRHRLAACASDIPSCCCSGAASGSPCRDAPRGPAVTLPGGPIGTGSETAGRQAGNG
jgi:hypothetical protein